MENKIYNDDVERIVNDPERQAVIDDRYEKRQHHRQQKMLSKALLIFAVAITFGLFGFFDLVAGWIANTVCIVGNVCGAFLIGRFFENGKCWGWH